MPKHRRTLSRVSATLCVCFAAREIDASAPAPDTVNTDSAVLAEVTVTASRREESVSKVPISISAYTQESMDLKGIKDIDDVARYTPGIRVDSSQTNQISIRGISSTGGSGTTGIYIDDVPVQVRELGFNADDALIKIFDLDRIEVLRGPQGTLFGAGSEGGTVRYITAAPSLSKSSTYGKAETAYTQGGAMSYELGVAGGGPLIDNVLGFRTSAWGRRDGGWIDRIDPTSYAIVDSNANHDDTTALRASLLWQPVDGLRITPSVYYQHRARNDVTIYWPNYSEPDKDRFVSANPTARQEPDRFYLPALTLEYEVGSVRLISTTAYFHRDETSGYDGTLYNLGYYQTVAESSPYFPLLDGSGVHLPPGLTQYRAPATVTNQQRNLSQELRLQSVDPGARASWTAGIFWSLNRQSSLEEIHDPQADQLFNLLLQEPIAAFFGAPLNPDGTSVLPMGDSYLNRLTSHDRQLAGFGELTFALTDSLKLTGGVRVARTTFSINSLSDGPQNSGPRPGAAQSSETPVTPKASLQWQADPNDMYYLTYAKGFRMGGGNPSIPYDPTYKNRSIGCTADFLNFGIKSAPATYRSDSVHSFEVGAKNTIGSHVRLASSAYYIRWKNIQGNVVPPICQIQWTDNLGDAISKGLDIQAQIEITRHLSLDASFGYTDARYTRNGLPSGASGNSGVLPLVLRGDGIGGPNGIGTGYSVPPWTTTVGAEYRFGLFQHDAFVRADFEYAAADKWPHAALEGTPANVLPDGTVIPQVNRTSTYDPTSFTLGRQSFASVRAGVNLADWTLSLFVDNLTDNHSISNFNHQTNAYDGNGVLLASPAYRYIASRPRTFGLTAIFRN